MLRSSVSVEQLGSNRVYVSYSAFPKTDIGPILETHISQRFSEEQPGVNQGRRVVSWRRQGSGIIRVCTDHFSSETRQGFMTHIDVGTPAEFERILEEWRRSERTEASDQA